MLYQEEKRGIEYDKIRKKEKIVMSLERKIKRNQAKKEWKEHNKRSCKKINRLDNGKTRYTELFNEYKQKIEEIKQIWNW